MAPRMSFKNRPSVREIAVSILSPSTNCVHGAPRLRRCLSRSTFSPSIPFSRHQFHTSRPHYNASPPPKSHDRGPASGETTQTDFSTLDVLGGTPTPSTAIDACLWDGFHLNNGAKISNGAGVLLVAGEAFAWRPWQAGSNSQNNKNKSLLNKNGQWEVPEEAWGILELVHPKPDLLILGVGPKMAPLSLATRQSIAKLGIRVEVQDTRNASAQFNLLATERGVGSIAAGLVPVGWREGGEAS